MRIDPPIVCLITNRAAITPCEEGFAGAKTRLVRLAQDAVRAGIDIIQVREPDLETSALVDLVAALLDIARGTTTKVVVNDRLDVALAYRASGVHLKAASISPAAARSIAPDGFLVGRSIHSRAEAIEHAPHVDYLIAGTVFPTASKPTANPLLGRDGLREIVGAVNVPVLAIGGVTLDRLAEIQRTGAAGVAGISLFLKGGAGLADMVDEVRAQFK
jgi:thiamine-phosphate diphosphorylase